MLKQVQHDEFSFLKRTYRLKNKLSSRFTLHSLLKKKAAFTLAEGATHVAHSHNIRRVAFTLAEVLITLGIIGVVAAMTIPTLINKYQMKVFETAFKKQYSAVQSAIDMQFLNNGVSDCYMYWQRDLNAYGAETSQCYELYSEIIKYMNLFKIDYSIRDSYARKAQVQANGGKFVNSSVAYDSYINTSWAYASNNGAVFLITMFSPVVIIDVNGEKGPNKWGYDVFFLVLSNHDGNLNRILLTDELATIVEKGGRLPRNILINKEKTEDSDFTIFWN